MNERDQVIVNDRGWNFTEYLSNTCHRTLIKSFEQAGDQNHVRLQIGNKVLANKLSNVSTPLRRGTIIERTGRVPDADILLCGINPQNAARIGSITSGYLPLKARMISCLPQLRTRAWENAIL